MKRTALIRIIAFFLFSACMAWCQKGPSADVLREQMRTSNSLPDAPSPVQAQADILRAFVKEASSPLTLRTVGVSADVRHDFASGLQIRGLQTSLASLYRSLPEKESGASAFFSKRVYPLLLKQTTRHYILTSGGFMARASSAASSFFVLHDDSGKRRPNTSNFIKALTSIATRPTNRLPYWAQPTSDIQRTPHP